MQDLITDINYSAESSAQELENLINKAISNGAKSLFVLACDANGLNASDIDAFLQQLSVPVFGGIFPNILNGTEHYEKGFLVCSLAHKVGISIHQNISQSENIELEFSDEFDLQNTGGCIMLVDGLSKNIVSVINHVYDQIGPDIPVMGGGAGSLSFKQKPCIFTNQGLLEDSMQLVSLAQKVSLGVKHGWEVMAGPYLVTASEDNTIHSLNFKPAYEVYRKAVEEHSNYRFEKMDFFEIAKTFPFGMQKLDDEILVRDPIVVEEGALVCVGKVPENMMIYILKGVPEKLIEATSQIVHPDSSGRNAFVFNCISRKLFLNEQFDLELQGIHSALPKDSHLIGALTLGEIANAECGIIQFHNKTAVVGVVG